MPAGEAILAEAEWDRTIIQEFYPLAESVEWQLGQRYLHERGTKAFLSDARPVPYVVNNDGLLSRRAAEVFFSSLSESEKSGSLEPHIFTLELGIGVGLFARYFLDDFRAMCRQKGKDYYDRLCYIAADCSEQMLRDACRHGVFADHAGRYLLRVVDALKPQHYLRNDVALAGQSPRPLRAVFLNYLLDCLPAAVLELDEHRVRQLCVRTCLARGTDVSEHTDLSAEQLAQRAGSANPTDQQDLLEVYGLFASEYDYRPVDIEQIPYGDFAVQFARSKSNRVLASYGAIQCLEHLLGLVQHEGFILINDYGQTQVTPVDQYEHQRFSHAACMGINFPLLKAYFADSQKRDWVEPPEENQSIHSRLLGHKLPQETMARFKECFTKTALDWVQAPAQQAREFAKAGRFGAAAASYRQALERQPDNWLLMNEIASFLTFSLRNVKAGIDMAKVALRLNPTSSHLWNTLGDSLFEFGRVAEARQVYLRAQQLNPNDAQTYYNLAWVYAREKNYAAGLAQIAEALARDETGEYRERLLQKQGEILGRLMQRNQQEYLRIANRISTAPAQPSEVNGKLGHNEGAGSPASKAPAGQADRIQLIEPTHLRRSQP